MADFKKLEPFKDESKDNPQQPEEAKKYRVLHFAVSGFAKDRKGQQVSKDFTAGKIVTSDDLDGAELHYLSMGAIEEV